MRTVFISSTFKDMQAERDVLHQRVFPRLRKRLEQYGEDVQELDLRWGVDTSQMSEEESGKAVIEACIDGIDRCKPYMVVLLGNRYGWIPGRKVIENTGDPRVLAWCQEESSITQMEILYGALSETERLDKCVFCFRNEAFPERIPKKERSLYAAESPVHSKKLDQLKKEIEKREDARIFHYDAVWSEEDDGPGGLELFEEQITEALWEMLSKDLDRESGRIQCREEQILRDAGLTAGRYLSAYVSRSIDQQEGANAVLGHCAFWFRGSGGSGKSAMMAKISDYAKKAGARAFLYYAANPGCDSVDALLSTLLYWLSRTDGTEETQSCFSLSLQEKKERLTAELAREREYDFVLLIDGVDQMEEGAVSVLQWLSRTIVRKTPLWHGLAVSSSDEYAERFREEIEEYFCQRSLASLTNVELDAIIRGHAARRGKKLDEAAVDCLRRKEGARNPYYLSLALQRLFMMNREEFLQAEALAPGMEGLSAYMQQKIEELPDGLCEMTVQVLADTASKLTGHLRQAALRPGLSLADPVQILRLLAQSMDGLRLDEIEKLLARQGLAFPPVYMEQLFSYLYDSFGSSGQGTWNFKHRILRESLLGQMEPQQLAEGWQLLLEHCETGGKKERECLYYAWKLQDMPAAARSLSRAAGEEPLQEAARRMAPVLMQALAKEGGQAFFAGLLERCDCRGTGVLLQFLTDQGERLLDWPQVTEILLGRLRRADPEDPLRLACATALFPAAYWGLDTRTAQEVWQAQTQAFWAAGCPAEACGLVLEHAGQLFLNEEFQPLYKEAAGFIGRLREWSVKEAPKGGALVPEELFTWARLAAEEAEVQGEDGDRWLSELQELAEKADETGGLTWRSHTAAMAVRAGRYRDGNRLLAGLLPQLEKNYLITGSLRAAQLWKTGLEARSHAVKEEYAREYAGQAYEVWKELKARFCIPGVLLVYARLCRRMYDIDRQAGETSAEGFLDEALQAGERLREQTAAGCREEEPGGELSEETELFLLKLRQERVALSRQGRRPWERQERQEADFGILEEGYNRSVERSGRLQSLLELERVYREEIAYYDTCHKESRLISAANKLLKADRLLESQKIQYASWEVQESRLWLAELLHRYGYYENAQSLTDQVYSMFSGQDSTWLARNRKLAQRRRRIIRFYLMQAKLCLQKEGEAETGISYALKAAEEIDKKGENQEPLPASDNGLRSELWVVCGRLFAAAGKTGSVAEILRRADVYWQGDARNNAAFGGQEGRWQLLEYCRGLALRARLEEETAPMDQAVSSLALLTACMENGDASVWKALYGELMGACRFYWKKRRPKETLPGELMAAMLPALRAKEERGELSKEEKILFAEFSVEGERWDRASGADGRCLPQEDWLQRVVSAQREQGNGSLEARVDMRLFTLYLLKGQYDKVFSVLMPAAKHLREGEEEYLRAPLLYLSIASSLRFCKPPKEALAPKVSEWLAAEFAAREAFAARYIELLGHLADCQWKWEEAAPDKASAGAETALRALALIREATERLGQKELAKTQLPAWALTLAKRLRAAREAGALQIEANAWLNVCGLCDKAARSIYGSLEDGKKKDSVLSALNEWNMEQAKAYREAGNGAFSARCYTMVFRQANQFWQQMEPEYLKRLLETWRQVMRDMEADKAPGEYFLEDWYEAFEEGMRLLEGLYSISGDARWLAEREKEAVSYRERLAARDDLPQPAQKKRPELLKKALSHAREAVYRAVQDKAEPAAEWRRRYRRVTEEEIEILEEWDAGEQNQILDELYALKYEYPEEKAAIVRLADLAVQKRGAGDSDLMYLTMQAVRDLGNEAEMPEVYAYIEKRRAGMPSYCGKGTQNT